MEVEKGEIITLTDGKEYMCLSTIISEDGRQFLYLMTTSEPIEFYFAEQTLVDGGVKMRVVGDIDEKHKLFDLLKAQSRTNSNRDSQHV